MAAGYGVYDFVERSVPIFLALVFLELLISPFTGKRVRINDVLTSITAASYFRIPEMFGISAISLFYWPTYEHRIFTIPYWSVFFYNLIKQYYLSKGRLGIGSPEHLLLISVTIGVIDWSMNLI